MAEVRSQNSRRWIIVIAIIIVASSTGYYLLTRPSTLTYETYENYGFSFEYPQGMMFTVEGVDGVAVPTMANGVLQGTLMEGTPPGSYGQRMRTLGTWGSPSTRYLSSSGKA